MVAVVVVVTVVVVAAVILLEAKASGKANYYANRDWWRQNESCPFLENQEYFLESIGNNKFEIQSWTQISIIDHWLLWKIKFQKYFGRRKYKSQVHCLSLFLHQFESQAIHHHLLSIVRQNVQHKSSVVFFQKMIHNLIHYTGWPKNSKLIVFKWAHQWSRKDRFRLNKLIGYEEVKQERKLERKVSSF